MLSAVLAAMCICFIYVYIWPAVNARVSIALLLLLFYVKFYEQNPYYRTVHEN